MQLLRYQGMGLVSFDSGCFGHPRRKPTTCLTNMEDMRDLDDQRSEKHSEALPQNVGDRCRLSSTWAMWAALRAAIREALKRHLKMAYVEDVEENPHLAKMTSEEAWEAHIRQGHRPYRRDCRTCVLEMGARSPHRRRCDATTSSWAMNILMPSDDIPEKGKPKTLESSWGDDLEEGDFRSRWKNIHLQKE